MIAIPDAFQRATTAREGERGRAWLAELPLIAAELLKCWDCRPDGEVTHGGVAVIIPVVRRGDGERAVVKVSFPHPGNVHEPDAFAVWEGRGAVRLLARDDARFAMLLERAHADTLAEREDDDEVAYVAGDLSRRLAVPAPPGLPRLADRADEWEHRLRTDAGELPHHLPRRVVDAAVATVRELGRAQPDVLVHGDLHARNILRAEREPWLAVDPKGCAGDPAYDAGTLLKARAVRLVDANDPAAAVHRILDVFTDASGLEHERVWRWAQFHAVDAAFWGRRHGFGVAREGPSLDPLITFAEQLATLLTDGRR